MGLTAGLAVCLLALVPLLQYKQAFWFYLMFWVTMATAFNIIYGLTGYLPFGYVAFYGIGAYTAAVLATRAALPMPLAVLCAGGAGVALSLVFFPTLRLKGIYFAIVNFACALALKVLVSNLPKGLAGGSLGVSLARVYAPQAAYYLLLVVTICCVLTAWLLGRSRLGIALSAIRDDPEAAEVVGIATTRCKLAAWTLAALFPSLAGGIDAWYTAVIDPETSFNLLITARTILFATFGGLGTVAGPVLGAVALYTLDDWIWGLFPLMNIFLLGLALLLLVLFLPQGLVGELTRRVPSLRRAIP